jgi:phasin
MSQYDQSRKLANETLEKGKAAAEQSARAMEQGFSTAVENMRDYQLKIIDMAHANMEAFFEFARQMAAAKAPTDVMGLWTTHARRQFEALSDQTKQLTALGQKMASESAEPMKRGVDQAFKQAS